MVEPWNIRNNQWQNDSYSGKHSLGQPIVALTTTLNMHFLENNIEIDLNKFSNVCV